MLYHHDSRAYDVAASQAAAHARNKLEGIIERGRGRALNVLHTLNTEVPEDYVVVGPKLDFGYEQDELSVSFGEHQPLSLHRHALSQACSRVNIPSSFGRQLKEMAQESGPWAGELLAHNLNELYTNQGGRYLLRSVDGQCRGFLSDRFRRLDSRPIFEAFALSCQSMGAVPVEGYAMQTKNAIKGLLPHVFEPVENEVLSIGLCLQNSDYGHGALSVRTFILRLWCTNYAIADECLRNVHLGRRLPDNVAFSENTYRLDTEATVSAVQDIVRDSLSPARIHALLDGIREANEQKVGPHQIKAFLRKRLNKGEAQRIQDAFNGADIINLPPGQTAWRLSNAISWVAGQVDDETRRLEMQQVAGDAVAHFTPQKPAKVVPIKKNPQENDISERFRWLELT